MPEILIVGAGPTGLVLASELLKYKLKVTLIDKASGPSVHSKALAIQARTLETFEKMGIVTPFLEKGLIAKTLFFYQNGQKIKVPLVGIDSFYPFVLILPQAETESLLIDHLHSLNGNVQWNTSFEGFEENYALIRSQNGIQKKQFSYIIGCDGAHSTVRHSLKIPFIGTKIKESFYLVDVQLKDPILEFGPHIFFDKNGISLLIPFKEERICRLIFPLHQNNYEQRLKKFSISSTLWDSEFTVHRRIAKTYRQNHILLAGDAAHVHSPAGGQGMNTSIQDAHNLAWKLSLIVNHGASDSLLNSYESERKPLALKILKGTTLATHLVLYLQKCRSAYLFKVFSWLIQRKWILKKIAKVISETHIHYKKSPIILGPQAGMKAPDVLMNNGKRLFEWIQSNKHILLLFDTEHTGLSSDILDVFVISDQNVRKKYKAAAGSMVIIRPDGYIGMRSRSFSHQKIKKYFKKLSLPS